MISATFFGHRDFDYSPYRDKVRTVIMDLIVNHGVEEFWNGFRGNFDKICAEAHECPAFLMSNSLGGTSR